MNYLIYFALLLLVLNSTNSYSQNPTYALDVNDGDLVSPNVYEFDIDETWTNPGIAPNYEMSGGQYFFDINGSIANGGTMTMQNAGSDLPTNMQPRNPTVFTSSTPWQLRWAVNTFPGAGNGFEMPPNTQIKILRVRLITTAASFANINSELTYRNSLPGPFIKKFAYIGTVNTDISTPSTHTMSITGYFQPNVTIKFCTEGLLKNNAIQRADSTWILIRSVQSPYDIVASFYKKIDTVNFTVKINTFIPQGNYYIVIKHKNSLETWSKPGGELIGNGNFFYDFTTSASQAYGNNLVLKDGLYCIYSGNVNEDDVIDAEDLLIVDNAVYNYASGTSVANLNGDNIVDIEDMAICDRNARSIRVVERPGALEFFKKGDDSHNLNYLDN